MKRVFAFGYGRGVHTRGDDVSHQNIEVCYVVMLVRPLICAARLSFERAGTNWFVIVESAVVSRRCF